MPLSFSYNKTNFLFWGLSLVLALCLSLSFLLRDTMWVYIPFGVIAFLFVLFYDIKILFFLLLVFIPLSIEYSVTQSLSTDLPDEGMMVGLTACIILYMVYRPAIVKNFISHPLLQLLLLHVAWILVAAIFSHNPVISIKYLLAKSWYILAFVFATCMLLKHKKDFVIAGLCLIAPMLLVMVWTLYNHSFEGFSFEAANNVMKPFFRNHVNYSAALVCIIPVLWLFWYFSRQKQKKYWRIVIIITLAGLFLSFARGPWLALLAGGFTVYFIKKKQIKTALLGAVAGLVMLVSLLIYDDNYVQFAPDFNKTIFHSNFGEHMVATYKLTDVSTAERFYRWIAGVRMSKEELVKGYGPNNFYDHYKRFADERFRTWVSNNEDHSSVHNYFLLLLIEQGIPGLVFFCMLLYGMFMYVQKLYHRTGDIFYKKVLLATGAILAMITALNLLSDLIETDKIGSLFFICLGVLVVIDLKTKEEQQTPSAVKNPDGGY
jgi:O-antigen ligase